jgi:hypothetical protein
VNIITYAILAYAITAAISFAVIGVVVLMSKAMSKKTETE